MLVDKTARDLVAAFAAPTPTPGGGSAAAYAGAMGGALLLMVASLPKTRTNTGEEREALDGAAATLGPLVTTLLNAVDADTAAYNLVVAAFKLPRQTDEEKAARSAAIQAGTRRATEVPLDVMQAATRALQAAAVVARAGNPSAQSDVRVAIELLATAVRGAGYNVDINLSGLKDAAAAAVLRGAHGEAIAAADAAAERARDALTE